MKLSSLLRALMHGGTGVAFAVLLPRALSLAAQWVLALSSQPAALAALANYMSRGMVVVSLVHAGLSPILARRTRALATRAGRALAGGALAMIAALAFSITLAHELALGLGGTAGLVTAFFSACSLLAAASPSLWPLFQREGRYLRSLAVLLVFSPGASMLGALAGLPGAVATAIGLAGASPALLLLRPTRLRRAARYAMSIIRRSIPYSIATFATVVVYPISLSVNQEHIGEHRVGQQVLYWSFALALSNASQAFAARAVSGASSSGDEATWQARALRAWLPSGVALWAAGALIYALFAIPIPGIPHTGAARDAMTATMLVSVAGPLVTDTLCVYFSGPRSRRALPIGSVLSSACMAGCLLLAPAPLVRHFGVFGPSVLVGVARLAFVLDAPVRRYTLGAMFLLIAAFAAALALGQGVSF
ncbi:MULTISPECIES: hypothetical protein [Sorangium]|uniref:Membrane protein involved in the export of O-antigen and teichoic acid n=1 Tax=Sorangium cellulosum TaxID=56 RepID=A0A4P2R0Z9_SORCE|nr:MULTISPECIES: hypothetical protein [Sorangium]AUX36599.1 hypothetical protein SOCE836_088070 [Sorangium cellulosum]WCQ95897.1 hypothetical protein NQZ70_08674 [Sorangium sp. Soce836]